MTTPNNAPVTVSGTEETSHLERLLKIIDEIDAYQQHPNRGDPDAECACCMGEMFDNGERKIIEAARASLAAPARQWPNVEEYVADYEWRGDGGDHTPTDAERELITDALHGYVSEIEANARLIAAAPELAECVQELKELFRFALLSTTPDIAKEGMVFVRKAESVLAKALPASGGEG